MDKVFFMPYSPKHSNFAAAQYEYGSVQGGMNKLQLEIDRELTKGNQALAVWYNGKKNPFLSGLTDGQIYIRGHGMPGFVSIEGGRGGERIDYQTLVDRLIESGLRKNFIGKIKCYNCHSAETGVPGTDPEIDDGTPFAQYVADALYAAGYKLCTFYGYTGSIDSFAKDGSAGVHKYVRVKDAKTYKQVEAGRASEGRIQFHPRIMPPKPKKPNIFKQLFNKLKK